MPPPSPTSSRRDDAAQAAMSSILGNQFMVEMISQQKENDNDPATVEERIAAKAYEIADYMEALA